MAEADKNVDHRDYPREIVSAPTEILIEDQWHQCLIVNISASGAKLYIGWKLTRNMPVSLKIGEFGLFKASVVWFQGDEVGVKFDLVPLEMERLLPGLASMEDFSF
jgi:hypothetical protein